MKDLKAEKDAWYLMASTLVSAMTNISLMTGNFDKTTGDVDYIEPRNPPYVCGVELLEMEERSLLSTWTLHERAGLHKVHLGPARGVTPQPWQPVMLLRRCKPGRRCQLQQLHRRLIRRVSQ